MPISYSVGNSDVPELKFYDCVDLDGNEVLDGSWTNVTSGVNTLAELDLLDKENYKITEYSGLGLQSGNKENENLEFKTDFKYQFDSEHLASIKFGFRGTKRTANRLKYVPNSRFRDPKNGKLKLKMNGPNFLEPVISPLAIDNAHNPDGTIYPLANDVLSLSDPNDPSYDPDSPFFNLTAEQIQARCQDRDNNNQLDLSDLNHGSCRVGKDYYLANYNTLSRV